MNNEPQHLKNIFGKVTELIQAAQYQVSRTINSTMVVLYWNIGKTIQEEIIYENRASYGKETVKEIAKQLQLHFGKGYSHANIARMMNFYNSFPDPEIVATVSQQCSWSHLIELIKQKDPVKRTFYMSMCINENWSVRQLNNRIDSMLFERTAISKKPEETIFNDLRKLQEDKEMSIDLFLKDPYILDFLDLSETYSEKDLETSILFELQKFILEFGSDFAFLSRQKRITVDQEDYYIDLLFFHRKLKRLVVIELKLGKFKPEYKSQLELYLRWLDKYEKQEGEQQPIGLLLCAEKSDKMIELLELDKSGIHVLTYLTELPPMELFKAKLQQSIEFAKKRFLSNKP